MKAPSQNSDSQIVDCSLQHSDWGRNSASDAIDDVNIDRDVLVLTGVQAPPLPLCDGGGF